MFFKKSKEEPVNDNYHLISAYRHMRGTALTLRLILRELDPDNVRARASDYFSPSVYYENFEKVTLEEKFKAFQAVAVDLDQLAYDLKQLIENGNDNIGSYRKCRNAGRDDRNNS